jgi:phosphocarrier protein
MLQQEAEIINKLGLHARASAKLTQVAGRFQANGWVGRNGRRVNAKSIMGVMMLAAAMGSKLMVETDGPDEQQAMDAVTGLIAARFEESE